jgi:hypothetical protein
MVNNCQQPGHPIEEQSRASFRVISMSHAIVPSLGAESRIDPAQQESRNGTDGPDHAGKPLVIWH